MISILVSHNTFSRYLGFQNVKFITGNKSASQSRGYTCDFLLALITRHPPNCFSTKSEVVARVGSYLHCLQHVAKSSVR